MWMAAEVEVLVGGCARTSNNGGTCGGFGAGHGMDLEGPMYRRKLRYWRFDWVRSLQYAAVVSGSGR